MDQPGGAVPLGRALDEAAARLRAAGVEGARRDARLLLAAALGIRVEQVLGHPERALGPVELAQVRRLIARRERRERRARQSTPQRTQTEPNSQAVTEGS